jgi:hypothetical protein
MFRYMTLSFAILGCTGVFHGVSAAQVFAYPNAGQTEQTQAQDRFECHQWSVSQSGFDPSSAAPLAGAPATPVSPPVGSRYSDQRPPQQGRGLLGIGDGGFFEGGGMVGDAATGAALGAAGGALAGDVGEGAAIGALASTVFGAFSRSSKPAQAPRPQPSPSQDHYRQQQQAANQQHNERIQRVDEYNRAFGACMTARDYTVN